MSRSNRLVLRVAELSGGGVSIVDASGRWPAILDVQTARGWIRAAAHLGVIGRTHRGRDDERRFQNPGQGRPVRLPAGTAIPLLLGLWERGPRPVLVAMGDPFHRMGAQTRQSLFMPLWQLEQASEVGWAEHTSSSGERITAFHPALLPSYVEMALAEARVAADEMISIIDASGLLEIAGNTSQERVRRASSALVRQRQLGAQIVKAYEGLCAMCGLNLGLVEGAHIYPVSAPQSPDEIWNGIALCRNHHSVFDQHLVWVEPGHREVRLHPQLYEQSKRNEASGQFVRSTLPQLRSPLPSYSAPRREMFERRYSFFGELYSWSAEA